MRFIKEVLGTGAAEQPTMFIIFLLNIRQWDRC